MHYRLSVWGLRRSIRQRGWTIGVGWDEGPGPVRAFTLNWSRRFGWPDLIVFGMDPILAYDLFHDTLARLKDGRLEIDDGLPLPGLLPPAVLCEVHSSWIEAKSGYFQLIADVYAGRPANRPQRYLQLVVADAAHRFPWDTGYTGSFVDEPTLWEPAPNDATLTEAS